MLQREMVAVPSPSSLWLDVSYIHTSLIRTFVYLDVCTAATNVAIPTAPQIVSGQDSVDTMPVSLENLNDRNDCVISKPNQSKCVVTVRLVYMVWDENVGVQTIGVRGNSRVKKWDRSRHWYHSDIVLIKRSVPTMSLASFYDDSW
jgi:hypothetical protein